MVPPVSYHRPRPESLDAKGRLLPSTAQMMCSGFTPPKVAICFYGAARTFPNTLVHESQREYLVKALGLPSDPEERRPTLFLHTTRKDMRGDMRKEFGGLIPEWTEADIIAAADRLGVQPQNRRIVEGPSFPLPECYGADKFESESEHVGSKYMAQSLSGQLSHRMGCLELIEAEEVRRTEERKNEEKVKRKPGAWRFDSVILLRADLVVNQPFRPWCTYTTSYPFRKWDWLFWLPRSDLELMIRRPYKGFYACQNLFGEKAKTAESWQKPYLFDMVPDHRKLPVFVTRLNQANMPANICTTDLVFSGGALVRTLNQYGELVNGTEWKSPRGNHVSEPWCVKYANGNPWNAVVGRAVVGTRS